MQNNIDKKKKNELNQNEISENNNNQIEEIKEINVDINQNKKNGNPKLKSILKNRNNNNNSNNYNYDNNNNNNSDNDNNDNSNNNNNNNNNNNDNDNENDNNNNNDNDNVNNNDNDNKNDNSNNNDNNEKSKNGNNDINIEKDNEEKIIKKEINKVKLPDINSILNEKLLLETSNNDPIFVSELLKMSNFNIKEKTKYYDRFCVMSKITFFIYHSKENYILLKKPLAEIPIKNIKTIVFFKINKNLVGYDHFYISIQNNNELKEILDQLDLFYFNDKIDNKDDKIENEELLLIFKSNDKTLIKKWYVLLNYFKNFNA